MGGVNVSSTGSLNKPIVVNNFGMITISNTYTSGNVHFSGNTTLFIKNYAIFVDKSANLFNAAGQKNDNSHLVAESDGEVHFFDAHSKIILDFGTNFELGKAYSLDKIIVDKNGNNKLKVDLSHLIPRTSLYRITRQGNSFVVSIDAPNSEIGTLYKSNIRTMNNFSTISESMIYPHKYKGTNRSGRKRVIRRAKKTASLFDSIDTFDSPSLAGARGWVNPNESSLRGSDSDRSNPKHANLKVRENR